MILEGNESGYGAQLAHHLMNPRDNDHVKVHLVDGFVAEDLFGAFAEAEAISQATQCQKYLFSLSLNPPPDEIVPVEVFEETIAKVERKIGLTGQPRAIVFHEKNGRRHAHCVWSRIDGAKLRAVNLSLYKRKLTELSRELYLTHEWDMPDGFKDPVDRDPLNFSRQEAGQAQRVKRDPVALKAMFKKCWEGSDARAGFEAALKEQGYLLARGDRRGFVAVDANGKIWSLSRWCGVKPKQMRARLGSEDQLPSVEDLQDRLHILPRPQQSRDTSAFEARRAKLVQRQREERAALLKRQEARRNDELKARRALLPKGLRGALARVTGQYRTMLQGFDVEVAASTARDRLERQEIVERHLKARRNLKREDREQGLAQSFDSATRPDPRQSLVLPADDFPFTRAQLVQDPALILGHISTTKASFNRTDVLRELARWIDNPQTLQGAARTALTSSQIVQVETDGKTSRYTTQDYLKAEAELDRSALTLSARGGFAVAQRHIEAAKAQQNVRMTKAFGGELSEEQCAALDHVLRDRQLASVVGLAGAGKSTLLETACDAWHKQGITVHGAALAGKAADGLESASGIKSRTLASLEMSWKNGSEPVGNGDVLVVDEAGMIGTRQMARVAAKMEQVGAKLVLVGDPDQLQPIEAGTPFRRVVEARGAAQLTEIHRQREGWQKQASKDLAAGRVAEALEPYRACGSVTHGETRDASLEALVETYAMDVAADGPEVSRLAFAHKRKDVFALNQSIRAALRDRDDPPSETLFRTDTGQRAFAKEDRIVFTRNDKDIGVKNGMLGTVHTARDGKMKVALDGDTQRIVSFDPLVFKSFDHGYAVTIHKSQGATVDQAYVLASRTMDKHLAYVAMTRHRSDMRLFVNDRDRPTWAARHAMERRDRAPQNPTRRGPSMG